MEYKIGEVSKILNISKEMIRYYEKQGILKPSRKEDNNLSYIFSHGCFFINGNYSLSINSFWNQRYL